MIIPSVNDFESWDKGLTISDESLIRLETFYMEMWTGAMALGPTFTLATEHLLLKHQQVKALRWRRKI